MKAFKQIEKVVLQVLEKDMKARKNDYYLYNEVLKYVIDTSKITLNEFLENFSQMECKLPSWKSVERCRRHIQELMPELKEVKTAVAREKLIEEYKLYNLSDIGDE